MDKVIRITSTYVENTFLNLTTFILAEDHLHIRGEYHKSDAFLYFREGSPPHTWRIRFA